MKRGLALLLSVIMVLGSWGCGKTAGDGTTGNGAAGSETAAGETGETKTEEREPVTLEFYTRVKEQSDQQAVFDELNVYLKEKLNTTVNWHFLGGEFNDKIAAIINTGEEYDACYTASIANYYVPNVSRGAFVDLTDMLAGYPDLYHAMPESFWDATRVNGRIYAVPNQQIAARQVSFEIPTKFLEGTGYTIEELSAAGGDLQSMKEYLKAAKEKFGATALGVNTGAVETYCGYEMLGGVKTGLAVKYGDTEGKVVNIYGTEEFRQMCEDIHELAEEGLLVCDTPSDNDYYNSRVMSETCSLFYTGTEKPGGEAEISLRYGVDMSSGGYGTPYLATAGITSTMWGISVTSKHPDRTLEVLNLINTDPYAMNLLAYGIEGTHWEYADESKTTIRVLDAGYNHGSSWALGNVFLTHPTEGQPVDVWEQTAALNESAERSPLLGFSYTSDHVEVETADVANAVSSGYTLFSGVVDVDQGIAELLDRMGTAGFEAMRADAQAQVDAFLGK